MTKYIIQYHDQSKISVEFDITPAQIEEAYQKALTKTAANTQLKGFRKGKAPREMVEAAVGKEKIYQEALNKILPEHLEHVLKEEAIKDQKKRFVMLDYPKFTARTEWTPGESFEVKADFTIYPSVDLGNYQKELRLKKPSPPEVTEQDVEAAIERIFEQYKKFKKAETQNRQLHKTEQSTASQLLDSHGQPITAKDQIPDILKDDDFAQAAGASNLEELRKTVKAELEYHNQLDLENKYEDQLVKGLLEIVKVDTPEILILEEMARIEQRFISQLSRIGTTLEAYLQSENKTRDSLNEEWRSKAIENTNIALALNEIRVQNNIEVTDAEVSAFALQNQIKEPLTPQQVISFKYIIGQSKALAHLKKTAQE